LNSFEVD